jgi:hypothetical protein
MTLGSPSAAVTEEMVDLDISTLKQNVLWMPCGALRSPSYSKVPTK